MKTRLIKKKLKSNRKDITFHKILGEWYCHIKSNTFYHITNLGKLYGFCTDQRKSNLALWTDPIAPKEIKERSIGVYV